jgi:hypothetical protein
MLAAPVKAESKRQNPSKKQEIMQRQEYGAPGNVSMNVYSMMHEQQPGAGECEPEHSDPEQSFCAQNIPS